MLYIASRYNYCYCSHSHSLPPSLPPFLPPSLQELIGKLEQLEVVMTQRQNEVGTHKSLNLKHFHNFCHIQEEMMVVMEKKKR